MTIRTLVVAATLVTLGATRGLAQEQSKPEPKPTPAAAASTAPKRTPQLVNIKVDVVLSEQRGSEPPSRRTLSVVLADGANGRIRSSSNVAAVGGVPLNVDAFPELLPNGKIRLGFNLQYDGPGPQEGLTANPAELSKPGTVIRTSINQMMSLIVENGKPIVAAQSADPIGDRKVTVEITATILKD